MIIYGYCRISRKTQNIERQVRNILEVYPKAKIIKETFTGTKLQGRKELDKILKVIKAGDMIVFDSASRMSRNAEEGCQLYEELFKKGVELVFLKEPHINSEVYRLALENRINITIETGSTATDNLMNTMIEGLNIFTMDLAKEQIKIVFQQAQKEVDDLHQRVAEGIITAKLDGKQIGLEKGTKLTTKKSKQAKEIILKHSKDFNGTLADEEVMKLAEVSRKTYYKYKKELRFIQLCFPGVLFYICSMSFC